MIRLLLQEIDDKFSQENFKRIQAAFVGDPVGKGRFVFFTHAFTRAETRLKLPHYLGFRPLDILQLSVTKPDTATVTWHYDSFDSQNIVISSSAACTVRAYIGRYTEDQGQ